jgi:hypothetical protein
MCRGWEIESSVDGEFFRCSHLTNALGVSRPTEAEEGQPQDSKSSSCRQRPGQLRRRGGCRGRRGSRLGCLRRRGRWGGRANADSARGRGLSRSRRRSFGPGRARWPPPLGRAVRRGGTDVLRRRPRTIERLGSRLSARSHARASGCNRAPGYRRRSGRRRRSDWAVMRPRPVRLRDGGDRRRSNAVTRRRLDDSRRPGRRGRRLGRRSRREQRRRIDVALRIVGAAHAQVDVRHLHLGIARGAECPHRFSLGDPVAGADEGRPEVKQRHRVAVCRPDRHRSPVPGEPPGEGDLSASRCAHE